MAQQWVSPRALRRASREEPMRRPIAATLLAGSLLATPHLTPGALAAHATAESDALASASAFADALLDRNGSTLDRERFPEAEAALSDARRQDPNNARWPLALGVIRMSERRAADAKPLFERAVALDANSADAQYWLATSLFGTINEASMPRRGIAGQAKDAPRERSDRPGPHPCPHRPRRVLPQRPRHRGRQHAQGASRPRRRQDPRRRGSRAPALGPSPWRTRSGRKANATTPTRSTPHER